MHNKDHRPIESRALARPTHSHPQMTALLKTFNIDYMLGYWPNDVVSNPIVANAYSGASNGEKLIIEFLLCVWDQGRDWTELGYRNFNLAHAVGTWGHSSRSALAVASWMAMPFFP